MLSLDDSRWQNLRQAYGSAGNIPALLRELHSAPTEPVWGELWSCLCHQQTVYTATFAAFPHILAAVRAQPVSSREEHLCFLGIRNQDPVSHPSAPFTVVTRLADYTERGDVVRDMIRVHNPLEWLPALAAQAGYPDIGERACQFFGQGVCPSCQATFSINEELVSQFR